MINYYNKEKGMNIPLQMWLPTMQDLEPQCLEQALMLTMHPKTFHHVAMMPDCHFGMGMPIGGVIATKECIIPAAVGVDIGCGMAAVKTQLTDVSVEQLKKIMGMVRDTVPVGFKHQDKDQKWDGFERAPTHIEVVKKNVGSARKQLGTLGGGNHFIEIQKGDDGHIWFMIHSGSRNVGLKIAQDFVTKAKAYCMTFDAHCPRDLSYLTEGTTEFNDYILAMNWALDFAKANRDLMIKRVKEAFNQTFPMVHYDKTINIHHNYAGFETHFGENVWVHRKGATLASKDTLGIIPGSQGTGSYIVKGLGNPESFNSCSHGAGRKLSRSAAKKVLDLDEQQKLMDDQNIVHSIRNVTDLDEAPGAYKDIYTVMENQKDLVETVVHLKPLAVVKG